ncbi:hypothetical protein D8B26_008351 [Coccidioides posadasii str. Silveira]|uniref:uncharacterized protein n=1 Tax=Coccidioides posadasii (strain RMSCC 757 / Silveira) TaxID=443226 RepID=UPI001BF0B7F5|nr:hypothetical protein D8B26_008351 [Coccidioides posadasii str. Silveira]
MSLSDLKVNGLYIILFIRHDPPVQDNFHWGLYLHRHSQTGGTKYHIKQQGAGWITDHGPTAGVFKSFLLKPVNGQIILKCDNLAALETEVKTWGNANAMGAAVNEQPRPIGASALCGLASEECASLMFRETVRGNEDSEGILSSSGGI